MLKQFLCVAIATGSLLFGKALAFFTPNSLGCSNERCRTVGHGPFGVASPDNNYYAESIAPDAAKMKDVIASLLLGSQALYTFASVRQFVNSTSDQYEWVKPSLILTQDASKDRNLDCYRYLRYPVSVSAIHEFIDNKENYQHLLNSDELKPIMGTMRDALKVLKEYVDADIVEFDDKFQTNSLVYAITVNRTNKRIAVMFRGSVTGGKDWFPTNVNWIFQRLEPLDEIDASKLTEDISVHTGFYEYLYKEPQGERKFVKFDQIVNNLRELYSNEEYKDYHLYISGHSLGGALTQLLAFELARSGKLKDVLPGAITAVSFASPRVGNVGYCEAFQQLERKGLLQHARFSNAGDAVPVVPFGFLGYQQPGLNFHLKDGLDMEIGFEDTKTLFTDFDAESLIASHAIESHIAILEQPQNVDLFETETITSLYKKYLEN